MNSLRRDGITLTIPEATIYSGLSRSFIYQKFASGELKRLKAGKRVLILRADMDAYLESIREMGDA